MKRLTRIGMAMLAMLAFAGCGSSKQATTTNPTPDDSPFGQFYDLPSIAAVRALWRFTCVPIPKPLK